MGQELPLKRVDHIQIVGCTNSKQKVHGITTLQFMTPEEPRINFSITTIVVDKLVKNVILGQDLMGSSHINCLKRDQVHFNTEEFGILPVKLHSQNYPRIPCISLHTCIIAPQTPTLIQCKLQQPISTGETFSLKNFKPNISHLDVMYDSTLPTFNVAIFNEGEEDIIINEKEEIFTAETISATHYNINTFTLENINYELPMEEATIEEFINKDINLTEDEKNIEKHKVIQNEHYTPSITKFIKDNSKVTELELTDEKIPTDEEFLGQFNIHHLPEKHQIEALQIFLRNKQAFSLHKFDIGVSDVIEMDVELNTNKPKMQKNHPIPLNAREKVKEILDQLLKYGIIRECHEPSPYCSNILVVRKKDGQTIRLLFDGRLLNYDTKRLPMALISKPEILSHLVGKQWLSSLDFSDAFFNIKLNQRSQPLTAFYSHTHGLRMCFNRAPQGLRNSPLYLKLLLDRVFSDMTEYVLFYADDLLIATDGTLTHHLLVINKVLNKLIKASLKLRPEKLFIAQEHIEFLGMIFTRGRISIPEKKLEAFKQLPSPNTPKKAKSVISCLSYYRHFCPRFAELSHEIHGMGQLHPKEYKWTPELETKFRLLINTIVNNAILYLPDVNKPYYVQTDASNYCAAGRVFQKNDKDEEMIIAAVSRTFSKTERHYSIVKKEILALLYTLKTMDFFLQFAEKLIILVDAKSIIYLRLAKESSGILLRFSLELSKYNAEMHHIPGEQNVVSDVLSRQHRDIDDIVDNNNANRTISEKDTLKIIEKLTIPPKTQFTKEELSQLISGPSPLDTLDQSIKKTKTKAGNRLVKNIPNVLGKKKLNLPKTTKYRPGMLLPTYVLTRAMKRSAEEIQQEQIIVGKENDKHKKRRSSSKEKEIINPSQLQTTSNLNEPKDQNKEEEINDPHETTEFSTIKTITNTIADGYLTVEEFKQAQNTDFECSKIIEMNTLPKGYTLIQGILHRSQKPVLPVSLIQVIFNTKHFTVFGIHNSVTRMTRDINEQFYISKTVLNSKLKSLTQDCYVCQIYKQSQPKHNVLALPSPTEPRQSWSIDLITDTPTTKRNNNQILVCVDDYSSFTLAIPLPDATAKTLIDVIKRHLIAPFGIPKILRSDEQASIYNSTEFYTFLTQLGIELTATAVASPFSNSRAESQIKNIKHMMRKFLFQENKFEEWDEYLPILSAIHNGSIGIYGFAPEEIMFGHRNSNRTDLLQIIPTKSTEKEYIEHILNKAKQARDEVRKNMEVKKKQSQTFKNKDRILKTFEQGSLVMHRQLQVSTGTSSKWKPLYKGPYVIIKLNKDLSTAIIEHLYDGRLVKAHFTNLERLEWNPTTIRFKEDYNERIKQLFNTNTK